MDQSSNLKPASNPSVPRRGGEEATAVDCAEITGAQTGRNSSTGAFSLLRSITDFGELSRVVAARAKPGAIRDDFAYLLPMAVFLAFTEIGVRWPALYPWSYLGKTFLVAGLLLLLRRKYTPIRWSFWWVGVAAGVVGIVQWIGMEQFLLRHLPHYPFNTVTPYNPFREIASPGLRWAFIAVRLCGAVLIVPFMEELFWRDFVWRTVAAPADFKLASIGELDWKALIFVSLLFSLVHVQIITALVWGLMIGSLLVLTRSLGACIVMHAVTNLLLGFYVLKTHDWYFW